MNKENTQILLRLYLMQCSDNENKLFKQYIVEMQNNLFELKDKNAFILAILLNDIINYLHYNYYNDNKEEKNKILEKVNRYNIKIEDLLNDDLISYMVKDIKSYETFKFILHKLNYA